MLLCCLGLQNLEGGKAKAGVLPYTTQFGVTILAATGSYLLVLRSSTPPAEARKALDPMPQL